MQFSLAKNHGPWCQTAVSPIAGIWQLAEPRGSWSSGLEELWSLSHSSQFCWWSSQFVFIHLQCNRICTLTYSKGKALEKVFHRTDMPTLYCPKNEYKPHSCLNLHRHTKPIGWWVMLQDTLGYFSQCNFHLALLLQASPQCDGLDIAEPWQSLMFIE